MSAKHQTNAGVGETISLVRLDVGTQPEPDPPWYSAAGLLGTLHANRGFILFVVIPTLLAIVYYSVMAADRYQTDARYVVKSPSSSTAAQLSGLVGASTIVRSSEDAYVTHAYFRSRDVVLALEKDANLIEMLSRPKLDLLWRYPGFLSSHAEERLWRHFQSFIGFDFDPSTGITVLSVQAFDPEDARRIAELLLERAEALINNLGRRAQTQAMESAEREVEIAKIRATESLERVTAFRRRTQMIDPTKLSASTLQTMTALALEAAHAKAELAELAQSSPSSPQSQTLHRRIAAFEEQMEVERTRLAGSDATLATHIAEYERLLLEREFSERAFSAAIATRENARIELERQRLFLERISSPATVDYAQYPYRMLNTLLVFLAAYVLYRLGSALMSDTLSHLGK